MSEAAVDAGSYIVRGESVCINAAGVALNSERDRVRAAGRRMEATLAGAVFAQLFQKNPWLDGFKLFLFAESAHDDAGRYYRSIGAMISDVSRREGAALPERLTRRRGGAIDEQTVEDWLEWALQDDAGDIYSSLADGEDCYEDMHFDVRRAALGDLLERDIIEGREALIRLFPEMRSLVEEATVD